MAQEAIVVDRPTVHLVHMLVFTLLVVIIAAVLFPNIKNAFMANPGLNGLIVATLIIGALYAYRMVWRLFPEVSWLNDFKVGQGAEQSPPILLAPMSTLLGDASETAKSLCFSQSWPDRVPLFLPSLHMAVAKQLRSDPKPLPARQYV